MVVLIPLKETPYSSVVSFLFTLLWARCIAIYVPLFLLFSAITYLGV